MVRAKEPLSMQTRTIPRRLERMRRPIDLVHLARQTLGDPGLEHEVLRMFERQIVSCLDRIRTAADDLDLRMGLHTLKAASRGVGAVRLADMAQAAERQLEEEGNLDAETVSDLELAVTEVGVYIGDLLED